MTQPASPRIENLKDLCLTTALDRVTIVPAPAYSAGAERAAAALRARFAADVRVTPQPAPDDYSRTLVVLGDLSTNPFIARLYHAYMCWTDKRYPGPGGYEVRTIHNPFGRARNVVLLGCSDAAGAERAAERFLAHAVQPMLGPLLDVELADDADAQFRAAAGDYYPYKPGLSNGLRYYLTGRADLGQAYRRYLLSFDLDRLNEQISGMHMLWLFDAALWDIIEEQPIFNAADRLHITNLFLALARSEEGIGFVDVPEIMDDDGLRQNHHTNAAFAVWLVAGYLERDYPDLPGIQDEIAHWRRVIHQAFKPGRTSSRGQCETWHEWELELDINFDYFHAVDDAVFVESGALRRAVERIILSCTNTGTVANSGDIFPWQQPPPCGLLGKAAFATGDARYRFFARRKSLVYHRVGMSGLNGIGREYDDGLAGVRPDDHVGVRYCTVDPAFYHFHGHAPRFYRERMFLQTPNTPLEKSLDKIAFRSGWSPQDQYLLIDGVCGASHGHEDANAILQFDEFERTWLVDGDFRGPDVTRHNALTIASDGVGSPLPAFAEKACVANLGSTGFSHSIMRDYGGADWGRAVVWLRGQVFVVLDRVTARTGGAYNLALRWFTAGERARESADGRLMVTQRAPQGASATSDALHLTTLLGEARVAFEAPDGEYRLQVDLSTTRATTWANSAVFDFDERYPVEFIIGDRLDPPGKVDEAVLEGRVRLRGGPAHVLRVYLGTAQSSVIRSVTLVSEDGSQRVALPLGTFTVGQRRVAAVEASFHIVPAARYEGALISGHPTLAEQWSRYAWHPITAGAIHEWQQTARVELPRGAAFTFANLLYAETPGEPCRFSVRQLRDGLVRLSGGEEAVAGFGPVDIAGVRSDAQLVFLAAHRLSAAGVTRFESSHVSLQSYAPVSFEYEARGQMTFDCDEDVAVELAIGGQRKALQLSAGRHALAAPALTQPLIQLDMISAQALPPKVAGQAPARRILQPFVKFDAPLRTLVGVEQGWLVGDEAGLVRRLDESGKAQWQFQAGGAVNSLDSRGDLIVAGCEDRTVYALDRQGRPLWQREFGLLPETYGLYAGLGQIRRVHIDDLDADGQVEIYVSPDNMHLHSLNADGHERWRMVSLYGPYTTYQAVDLYGDGRRVLVGGMSFNTCHSAVQVIDHTGHYIDLYVNDGWTSSLGAVWVGDIDADGKWEIAAGTNRGWVRMFDARLQPLGRPMPPFYGDVTTKSFAWAEPRDRIRWASHLGEPVRAVAGFAGLVVGAADNGFVTAFDPSGVKRWHARAHEAATQLVIGGALCYALGRAGEVTALDAQGAVTSRVQLGSAPTAAESRDGRLVVTCTDGGLYVI